MASNGNRGARGARIEMLHSSASPEEAAAIAAAIEEFTREGGRAPGGAGPPPSRWLRAALVEGVGLDHEQPGPWGDPDPWGRRREIL